MKNLYPSKKKNLTYTYTTKSFSGEIILDPVTHKKRFRMLAPYWYQNEINKFEVGEKVSTNITNKKPKRTEQQNRYYWGVYLPLICEEIGEEDPDYLHELYKKKFLRIGTKIVHGEEVTKYRSTTNLSTGQFCQFILDVERFTKIAAPPPENYDLAPLK